jgi:3-hydroxybutyrate dehydrogenase
MRLKDKVGIVAGAASRIGKEIAITFAREGVTVAIADLVAREEQVDAGTRKVIETFGVLDLLVSNAGVQIVGPLVDSEFARWKKPLAIHLDGAFVTTRAALRQMHRQPRLVHGVGNVRRFQCVVRRNGIPLLLLQWGA